MLTLTTRPERYSGALLKQASQCPALGGVALYVPDRQQRVSVAHGLLDAEITVFEREHHGDRTVEFNLPYAKQNLERTFFDFYYAPYGGFANPISGKRFKS